MTLLYPFCSRNLFTEVVEALRARGHTIEVLQAPRGLGNAHGLTIEYDNSGQPIPFTGAADPRGNGLAQGL